MYDDENEVRARLTRMADRDPLGPVDSVGLLQRGIRGKRRRRVISAGAALATIAAVTFAATLLPNLGTASGEPPAASAPTTPQSPTEADLKTTIPYAKGTEMVPEPEALARCRAQWSRHIGQQVPPVHVLSGEAVGNPRRYPSHTSLWIDYDDKPGAYDCNIPNKGEDDLVGKIMRPKPPHVPNKQAQADPAAGAATVLKACSVASRIKREEPRSGTGTPVDLTGWHIVARGIQPAVGTAFVAVSPAGDRMAQCIVYRVGWRADSYLDGPVVPPLPAPARLQGHMFEVGSQCGGPTFPNCTGWLYQDLGRVPTKVARFSIETKNGRTLNVPVNNGWYAVLWADGNPKGQPDGKVTAYDKDGNVVEPG